MDASLLAVSDDRRRGRDESGQAVEGALRSDLLDDADRGVRDEHAQEERVAPVAEGERDRAEDEQDQVEDREDVGADDARVGAARRRRLELGALREQARGFGFREPERR